MGNAYIFCILLAETLWANTLKFLTNSQYFSIRTVPAGILHDKMFFQTISIGVKLFYCSFPVIDMGYRFHTQIDTQNARKHIMLLL